MPDIGLIFLRKTVAATKAGLLPFRNGKHMRPASHSFQHKEMEQRTVMCMARGNRDQSLDLLTKLGLEAKVP